AYREYELRICRLLPDEREDRLVVHQLFLSVAAGNYQHVELRRLRDGHLRRQNQPFDVVDRFSLFPDHVKGRVRYPRQYLERPGKVDLVHTRKDDRADMKMFWEVRDIGQIPPPRLVSIVWASGKTPSFDSLPVLAASKDLSGTK